MPPPPLAGFGFDLALAGPGSEPDGENAAICGTGATVAGVTADGATDLPLVAVALPIAKAPPKATAAAITPMSAKREPVSDTCPSSASRSPR